jgi:hypothetical protein
LVPAEAVAPDFSTASETVAVVVLSAGFSHETKMVGVAIARARSLAFMVCY